MAVTGAQVARYFERVLGVRRVAKFDLGPAATSDVELPEPMPMVAQPICLLVEVDAGHGASTQTPSLQVMGSRMVEAIRGEWLKHSAEVPTVEWIQTGGSDWQQAIEDRGARVVLAIVCGVQGSPVSSATLPMMTLHVPSFVEMQSNPVQKREAWRSIQGAIRDSQ